MRAVLHGAGHPGEALLERAPPELEADQRELLAGARVAEGDPHPSVFDALVESLRRLDDSPIGAAASRSCPPATRRRSPPLKA